MRAGGPAVEGAVDDTVPAKRQQGLLEKVAGGRPTSDVIKSNPVGVANIANAPKLSDFKEGSSEERIQRHAAAMTKWAVSNL